MTIAKYKTLAIGLTGGIGSGKTEVGKLLAELGGEFLQSDLIAREFIDSKANIKEKISKVFGSDSYLQNGKLDRQKMAQRIFSDNSLQEKLNHIVHPSVIEYIDKEVVKYKNTCKYPIVIVEAALIFEAGVESLFDYIIVVDADEESRITRLMVRDHKTRREVLQRFGAQLSPKTKIAKADFVIQNNGSIQSLKTQCQFIYQLLTKIAAESSRKGRV